MRNANCRVWIVPLLLLAAVLGYSCVQAFGQAGARHTPPRPTPSAQPQTTDTDTSRIIRVWDIQAGAKPGENVYARPREVGERIILSTNTSSLADLPLLASAGFTLLQTDSDPLSTEETAPGVWDFRRLDSALRLARERGFDGGYFPHFAFPPKWYADQVSFTRIACLEHEQTAPAFSPWEPKFGAFAARGYQKLAEKYGSNGNLAALYLGVHGDDGACGLLTGAQVAEPDRREEWQRRFGSLHNHPGWWCADELARAHFRDSSMRKYHDLDVLNAAWKTRYRRPEQITYPRGPSADSRRYWLDFAHWYRNSVGGMADTICRVARRAFPETLLMLPVGLSDENPRGGNDNSLLPKIAARYRVEVRARHVGVKPFAESQATILGRIASACRFYGVPFWTETPGRLTPEQTVARIFASASLGAKGHFDGADNVREGREVYYRYGRYLRVEQPIVDVAMFFPTTSHLLQPDVGYPPILEKGCADLRDLLNYDIVDERMVMDGALDRYRVLVMWEGAVVEAETLAKIRDWVQAGGVLTAYDFGKIETVEGDRAWFSDLFGYAGRLQPASVSVRFVPAQGQGVPARYRIAVGQPEAAPFLAGDWYAPEALTSGTGASARRWTGANAEVRLPVHPSRDHLLTVRGSFPLEAAEYRREVLVNGRKVGEIDEGGEEGYRFRIPASLLAGREVAILTFRCETWVPAREIRGSRDRREFGLYITQIEMDASNDPVPAATLPTLTGRFETAIDLRRLRTEWARPYGQGWTVYYPATRRNLPGYYEVVRYLTYHLSDLDDTKQDAIPVDDAWDGIYATLLSDKILYYNPRPDAVTRTIVLPPAAFAGRRDLKTPSAFTHTLTLEPNSIGAIYFDAPPQELLLQCEKFTEIGRLRPQEGTAFSPGRGATHVLIPVGGQITTRFQCDVPGRYRVFYRAVRRGGIAQAEALLDGKPPERREPGAESRGSPALTRLAGEVTLSRGIHALTLRPRRGEDIRADYVILTTDPTIAGYGFGVRPAPGR